MKNSLALWYQFYVYGFHSLDNPLALPSWYAQYKVYWPGQTIEVCNRHHKRTLEIAKALQFECDFGKIDHSLICQNCINELKANYKAK